MLAAARERRARAARRCGAVVQLRGEAARVAHARLAASPPLGREGAEWVAGGAVPAGRDACGFAGRSGEMQPALAPRVAATRWRAAEGAGVGTIDDDGDAGAPPTPAPAPPALHVACAVPLQEGETSEALAQALLRWVLETGGAPLEARVCLLQRECARLPLGVGSGGLSAVVVSKDGLVGDHSEALALLGSWGLFAVPCALGRDLVSRLREAICTRTDAAEAALAALGRPADVAAEGNHYAELSHRGVGRFDLLLGSKSERLSCSEAVREAAERGPWVGAVAAALGGDAHALLWTAGAVVSRPGAPAGRWHADGGHTKFCFGEDGDSATTPYAVCVFVPLVDVREYRANASAAGCTVFWPGSHRNAGCLHLGSVQAEQLGGSACLSAAPMEAGSALVYDFRCVHAGAPNDSGEGERPIMQIVYSLRWSDAGLNYGEEQLFDG